MTNEQTDTSSDIDLHLYWNILLRRRWIVFVASCLSVFSAILYIFTTTPIYKATALILIEKEDKVRNYGENALIESTDDDYYQTQYKLIQSRSLLKKVFAALHLEESADFPNGVDDLLPMISISPVVRSRLVQISADSPDPQLATDAANTLAKIYVKDNIESKLYISKEIMNALFSQNDAAARAEKIDIDALPAVVNNPLLQNLKIELANLETKHGEKSKRYTSEHPDMQRVESQMRALNARMQSETDKIVRGLKAELSGQLLGNNIRIVDPAELPKLPYKPRKSRTLLLALAVGFITGYLLAVTLELLDQTLHTQEDVERKLGLPFLGAIPMAALDSDSAEAYGELLKGPKSFTGESLKNIRTMIGFAAAGKPMKSILVTSTGQGEGKTFIAMSLAMVFSHLGEKVLLIEGDLRRPSLHKRFKLSKERGLSHFLAHGKEVEEAASLIQSSGQENLDVLVCGKLPPNPSELLSTPRLQGLIDWAKKRYDRVLIDGTPIFPITDALLWARYSDAAAFVVKFGGTNGSLASKAAAKLAEGGAKIAGAVVNQVTAKANSYYGDYYYYYYHSDYTDSH